MIVELKRRVEELETKLDKLIRVGIISEVKGGNVRVMINDVSTHELPVLFPKTQDDKFQFMPDIGEQVLCVFLPFDVTQGFVIGSMFSGVDSAPVEGSSKAHIKFKDNAILEYDRDSHKLTIDILSAAGDIEVKCKNLNAVVAENTVITTKNSNINVSETAEIIAKNLKAVVSEKAEITSEIEVIVKSPKILMGENPSVNCVHSGNPCPLGLTHSGTETLKVTP
ncbi:MAG: phage baseplate assembly protein V [Desulfobacterales bacterium]|nr:phage baseplate assembly protein V [Desulfobacterales bacterium]